MDGPDEALLPRTRGGADASANHHQLVSQSGECVPRGGDAGDVAQCSSHPSTKQRRETETVSNYYFLNII